MTCLILIFAFDSAGAAWFVLGLIADGAPYHWSQLPAALTNRNRTTSGDN